MAIGRAFPFIAGPSSSSPRQRACTSETVPAYRKAPPVLAASLPVFFSRYRAVTQGYSLPGKEKANSSESSEKGVFRSGTNGTAWLVS